MLPFLKPRPQTGVIVKEFKSATDSIKENHDEDHGLMSCSEDLIRAVHAKDANGVKEALKAAFDICENYTSEDSSSNSESDDSSESE